MAENLKQWGNDEDYTQHWKDEFKPIIDKALQAIRERR
jgi:hypothetical protein